MKAWLKGGLIGIVVYLVIGIIDLILVKISGTGEFGGLILMVAAAPIFFLLRLFGNINFTLYIFLGFLLYFLIGSIIGLIISLIIKKMKGGNK